MTSKLEAKPKECKEDLIHLLILLSIASILGIYLISTSVLIAQDGVFYIEQAQKLSSEPIKVIRYHSPGYPFLIFISHKIVMLFSNNPSAFSWAYTAQSLTLLCRLLALIPLYFIGKLLVGSRQSFWAILILIILPYPARIGADALRDWPHILFLSIGLLFLLLGAKNGRWWFFGISGLSAGLGYLIRDECVQVVFYGLILLVPGLFMAKANMKKSKVVYALFALLVCFSAIITPYIKIKGSALPEKLVGIIGISLQLQSKNVTNTPIQNNSENQLNYVFVSLTGKIVKSLVKLAEKIGENLMYFFVPAFFAGIYYHFRGLLWKSSIEKFFVSMFILSNIVMLVTLETTSGYLSKRHCLPLCIFLVFYVPSGLKVFSVWQNNRVFKDKRPEKAQQSFFILLAIGLAICFPKLLKPIRSERQYIHTASKWIKANTSKDDRIDEPDGRISFYAERHRFLRWYQKRPTYAVRIQKNNAEEMEIPLHWSKIHTMNFDEKNKKLILNFYKIKW